MFLCEFCDILNFYSTWNNQKTFEGLWRRSGVFIINFEHILHVVLVFLLLTLFDKFLLRAVDYFYLLVINRKRVWNKS